ncbi:hypothetical protein CWB96_00365 [Pseudoalteromonas citrea]|uniref:Uncharacterized protein n=1 Tax=Pseudoalteromonas citrea TaxID=43655 RepID=A0A5S3XW77_9GAMM|nr:hypothetical protein [Pseudoalteromonas citrea]TMP46320.1 hypothetical protein CWB97_02360 [Pseudoalteromonas citrea]TMP63096.1 hypothetical protein CWB96_00365 [Pseudoalteromonas citrea]
MLKIEGQFVLNLSIGEINLNDAQSSLDLQEIEMIESVGTSLPVIRGTLFVREFQVRALFHEGNKLVVGFGQHEVDIDTTFIMTNISVQRVSAQYLITFTGVYDALSYLSEHKQRAYPNTSAISAIKTVAKAHFHHVDSNIAESQDKQTWLQPNDTDKKFISDTWLYADLPNSMPMVAINTTGEFLIRDLQTLVAKNGSDPHWRFLPNISSEGLKNTIWYSGDYLINTNSGFTNHWLGYGNALDVRDRDLGEYETVLEEPIPQLVKASAFPRRSDVNGRRGTPQWLNDNQHARYWHAYHQNITSLALFSTVTVKLSYSDTLHSDMKVLDLASFLEADSSNSQVDKTHTGLYIISKISRKFTKNHIVTTVELSRESHEGITGDIR